MKLWASQIASLLIFGRLLIALPTVVLVPGGWHSPAHYDLLRRSLAKSGYDFVSERNPSCGAPHPDLQTAIEDATYQRNKVILPLLNAGKEVIVVAHSYGGGPGSAAAKGLSLAEMRSRNERGGIVGLILISAIITQEGQSFLDLLPGHVFETWVVEKPNGQLGVWKPVQVFYNHVAGHLIQFAVSLIRPQSRAALSTPNGAPAWRDSVYEGRLAYWNSLEDQAISDATQRAFLKASGVRWTVKRFPSDHSPFLSFPDELAEWIDQIASGWSVLSANATTNSTVIPPAIQRRDISRLLEKPR